MCLAQGPQPSDAGEARTRGPLVSSPRLFNVIFTGGPEPLPPPPFTPTLDLPMSIH